MKKFYSKTLFMIVFRSRKNIHVQNGSIRKGHTHEIDFTEIYLSFKRILTTKFSERFYIK